MDATIRQWAVACVWAVLALVAIARMRESTHGRTWLVVAGFAWSYAVETVARWRFATTELFRQWLHSAGGLEAMQERRVLQIGVLVCVILPGAVFVLTQLARTQRLSGPEKRALFGCAAGGTGLALEVLSLFTTSTKRGMSILCSDSQQSG